MIKRDLFDNWFTKKDMSKWQCPTCNTSSLKVTENNFIQKYNSATEISLNEEWFDAPDMITYRFTTLLSCTNPSCKEVVACSGEGYVQQQQYSYNDFEYIDYFKPYFFYPSLNIFHIPDDTPRDVSDYIESSFALVFTNKSSSANQIRVALENLLTHLKVNKTHTNSSGRRKPHTLHRRIELLPPKHVHLKELCLAIKWLGNSGSHNNNKELSFDDIFDGYDMLSFILNELYDSQEKHVKKLAKRINTKKGA